MITQNDRLWKRAVARLVGVPVLPAGAVSRQDLETENRRLRLKINWALVQVSASIDDRKGRKYGTRDLRHVHQILTHEDWESE